MMKRALLAGALSAALLAGVGGCTAIPGLGPTDGTTTRAKDDGKVLQLPENTVYQQGQVAPSPAQPGGGYTRGDLASLPPLPTGSPGAATTPRPYGCTGTTLEGARNGLSVVPASTSATVTWYDNGDPALVEYQLAAVSQLLYYGAQGEWPWMTVNRSSPCSLVTATFTGLTPRTPYVFVLHSVLERYESLPNTAPEIARSNAVATL